MQDLNDTRQLLVQLLTVCSPELGARLKQRLNAVFISSGRGHFDEKAYGYQKFKDFLLRAHGDILSVERSSNVGDILVTLRQQPALKSAPVSAGTRPPPNKLPVIRSDVWQAFSNPDPGRKRYFHKTTGILRHYLVGESSQARNEVDEHPGDFQEISPIGGETQIGWMREFLDGIRLSPSERAPLEALINEPYSSSVNATFSRALGEHGTGWRHYRTKQVTSRISAWATEQGIQVEHLYVQSRQSEPAISSNLSNETHLSPRQKAIKLLELLTEQDIARVIIPTLVSSILIRSQA